MTSAEVSEEVAIELFPIISDQHLWQTKMTYYILQNKALYFEGGDGGERLCFNPLGEVINSNYCKLCLPLAFGKWANYVNAPLRERPWAADGSH